ncbi:hypothetical protein BH11ACT5_BH11ACT5_14910 [soil metagenome]
MRDRAADAAAEAILLAGGARAILLQLAHPAVGRGVAEHSDFAERPLGRLHGTLTYLYVIRFGTPEEAASIARHVGAAHRPVVGEGYDARDVALQVWVAATIHDTAVRMHELVLGPADEQELLDEAAIVATTLGVPRSEWPATPEAFAEYWGGVPLRVEQPARDVAQALLHPATGPLWMRALMPTVRLVTAGLLDDDLREAYGLPLDARKFERLVRVARAVYPRLPRFIRHAPMRRYLREFRRGRG